MTPEPKERRRRWNWRAALRACHRDAGYMLVGLTLIYAVSGLAVNHIQDWDPNFQNYRQVRQVPTPLPPEDAAAAAQVLATLGIRESPQRVDRYGPDQLDIRLERRVLHVEPRTGRVVEEGQKERWLIRLANWLHLNRGKKAWTLIADAYAVGLIFLAISGMFMLPGKLGMRGRGLLLVMLGAAVPILYVVLSGGPNARPGGSPPPGSVSPGTSQRNSLEKAEPSRLRNV